MKNSCKNFVRFDCLRDGFIRRVTDIYATSIDYDSTAQITRLFLKVQNQLHWAIHGETAAEVIYHRADSEKQYMGLQTWKDAPDGRKYEDRCYSCKNYLTEPRNLQQWQGLLMPIWFGRNAGGKNKSQ